MRQTRATTTERAGDGTVSSVVQSEPRPADPKDRADLAGSTVPTSSLRTWPLDRGAARGLLAMYLVTGAVMLAIGLALVHLLDDTAVVRFDDRVARWFEGQRTPFRNDLGHIGANLADAYTITPGVILLSVAFVVAWRRWHDVVMLGGALLLEKLLFLPVTLLVGRDRPDVPQLDGAPPTSSFPSGHVAAAGVVYAGLAIVLRWHVRNRFVRSAVVVVAVVVPLVVLVSRLHLGMHHVTDVVVGAVTGVLCLVAVHRALTGSIARLSVPERRPARVRSLDRRGTDPRGVA